MKNTFFAGLFAVLFLTACQNKHADLKDGLYAEIETSKGTILAELYYQETPVTVANFVSLAEGKNAFVDKAYAEKPFFNDLLFHRVIADFMIQTGDPAGTGAGDAGYKFRDEITDLRHDKPGVLSMANSGPNTNSSQFFITHGPTPWLDGLHSVFGQVVEGQAIVDLIRQNDLLYKVRIIRVGEDAKRFNAPKVFSDYFEQEANSQKHRDAAMAESARLYEEKFKSVLEERRATFDEYYKKATKTKTGIGYLVLEPGNGEKPKPGENVFMSYSGFLSNGRLFDSNEAETAKKFGIFDATREKMGLYRPMAFAFGRPMIPGFTDGLNRMSFGERAVLFIPSELGYGAQGAGDVIPPNSDLIFEVTLKKTDN